MWWSHAAQPANNIIMQERSTVATSQRPLHRSPATAHCNLGSPRPGIALLRFVATASACLITCLPTVAVRRMPCSHQRPRDARLLQALPIRQLLLVL